LKVALAVGEECAWVLRGVFGELLLEDRSRDVRILASDLLVSLPLAEARSLLGVESLIGALTPWLEQMCTEVRGNVLRAMTAAAKDSRDEALALLAASEAFRGVELDGLDDPELCEPLMGLILCGIEAARCEDELVSWLTPLPWWSEWPAIRGHVEAEVRKGRFDWGQVCERVESRGAFWAG
jgi:hypothetical protein